MPRRSSTQLRFDAATRTVSGILLPYGRPSRVLDAVSGRVVQEVIEPGALEMDVAVLRLTLMHEDAVVLAEHIELTDTPDALQLRAVLDGPAAAAAIKMLERGSLEGLSAEFEDRERVEHGGYSVLRAGVLTGASVVDRPAHSASRAQLRRAVARRRVNSLGGVWL